MSGMRKLMVAAVMLVSVTQGARAADMPDYPVLRGSYSDVPTRTVNWDGFYVGGHAGYGSTDTKFGGSNSDLTGSLLANTLVGSEMGVTQWPLGFRNQNGHTESYGGFAGYNSQWDDVVIGLEMSYAHGKFGGAAAGSMSRYSLLSDNNYHSVTSQASSSIAISDIGTFRARAGYAIGGFLPYLFGGLALGQADIVRTAFVSDFVTAGPASTTPANLLGRQLGRGIDDGKYSHLIYGYTAGLGFDMAIVGGLFLRGEWEYVRFTSKVDTGINTVRAGLGYKF
jgi:outer membrane immunogenic protein